jgi:hypothetical protein
MTLTDVWLSLATMTTESKSVLPVPRDAPPAGRPQSASLVLPAISFRIKSASNPVQSDSSNSRGRTPARTVLTTV